MFYSSKVEGRWMFNDNEVRTGTNQPGSEQFVSSYDFIRTSVERINRIWLYNHDPVHCSYP